MNQINCNNMTYQVLLRTEEWRKKRKEIVKRDGLTCQNCNNDHLFKDFINTNGTKLFNSNTVHVSYSIQKSPKDLNRKTVFRKDVYSWKHNSPYSEIQFYFDKEEYESEKLILNPVAARRIKKEEKDYLDDLSEDDSFLKNGEIDWIFNRTLHVHHEYYKQGLKPWEYPNDALTSLCFGCHEKIHKEELIPCYDSNGILLSNLAPCKRCYGAGELPQYFHVEYGICFRCDGAKYEEFI
ncbi:MAG: hypothetical protein ABJA32_02860 [Ginsengibacter sp.]